MKNKYNRSWYEINNQESNLQRTDRYFSIGLIIVLSFVVIDFLTSLFFIL